MATVTEIVINPPQHVHLTLHATFHSLSPLNVQQLTKWAWLGMAKCRKVITVEIAYRMSENSENPSNSSPRVVLNADGSGKTICQSNIKAAIAKKQTRPH